MVFVEDTVCSVDLQQVFLEIEIQNKTGLSQNLGNENEKFCFRSVALKRRT